MQDYLATAGDTGWWRCEMNKTWRFEMNKTEIANNVSTHGMAPFLIWLGGAVHVYNVPGYEVWDAMIWFYYVGRYVAVHFAQLN
jgi:hypothetical protein